MITMSNRTLLAVLLLILAGIAVPGLASEVAGDNATAQHKFELARQYYGQCTDTENSQFDSIKPYLRAFTDMEVMAGTMADPVRFSQLMAVVNDPRTIHVMTKCATEPVMWDTWMSGMTDFGKMLRTMSHFMNPSLYFNWMRAPMNPAMVQPMMQMMSPDYYTRWYNAMMNPAFYQPMTSMVNPGWYAPRINWMMNPQSMQPMLNMMHMGSVPAAPDTTVDTPAQ